jgi:hypothetical protein
MAPWIASHCPAMDPIKSRGLGLASNSFNCSSMSLRAFNPAHLLPNDFSMNFPNLFFKR